MGHIYNIMYIVSHILFYLKSDYIVCIIYFVDFRCLYLYIIHYTLYILHYTFCTIHMPY